VEITCQFPVHLFDKSDTFAERKKKTVQSRSRLTRDHPETVGFSGRVLQNITPFENFNIDITYNIQLTILVSNCG
jgi:hypothetical protein